MRALAVEIHEDWIEQHRYLNMALLKERNKQKNQKVAALCGALRVPASRNPRGLKELPGPFCRT
jgi:hypothetical protein